ncbi:MAG: WHG domain-containing protein [Clostridia bacterium]|nr:WHG domain-containing protein [Clostridia bacterium]
MPPKAKFTKNEITEAAMRVVERYGADFLTARSLAAELGSSARPVFTVFSGMEQVQAELIASATEIYGQYVEEGLKEEIAFKGVGKAYIRFAIERPKLFQLLFMKERGKYLDKDTVLQVIEEHYESIILSIQSSYRLDREKSILLYENLWIYSHGIAVLLATKVCSFTVEQISEMLTIVFKGLINEIKRGDVNAEG